MHADFASFFTATVASLSAFFFRIEVFSMWILAQLVKVCLVFPKTSSFKELKNKPVLKVEVTSFNDVEICKEICAKIKMDPNFKIYGVSEELSLVVKAFFYEKEDLLLSSMDNIVISKMGMELMIIESKKVGGYDRSLFIDLTSYRSTVFQFHISISLIVGFLVFFASGNNSVREIMRALFSTYFNNN